MAKIIDGKKISAEIKEELKTEVAAYAAQGKKCALAVIQVGADPASSVYVRNKKKACAYIGIESLSYELPEETTEEELLALIQKLNDNPDVRGILCQLPLPKHICEDHVIQAIDPQKMSMVFIRRMSVHLWLGKRICLLHARRYYPAVKTQQY